MGLVLGITGSRKGPSELQAKATIGLLEFYSNNAMTLRHGCCVGFDEFAAVQGKSMGFHVIAHPPLLEYYLSNDSLFASNEVLAPKDYLDRDRDIVDFCDLLIVAPNLTEAEQPRSGTWYTYRYAKKQSKPICIIWSDGRLDRE